VIVVGSSIEHYLSLPEPKRSNHLWRYSPWRKMHPTGNIEEVPNAVICDFNLSNLDGTDVDSRIVLRPAQPTDYSELGSVFSHDHLTSSFQRAVSQGRAMVLSVPKAWVGEQPIRIDITGSGHASSLHLLLDIGAEAEVELATSMRGEASWVGLLREGVIGDNAKVREYLYNRMDSGAIILRSEAFQLGRDATFQTSTLSVGGSRVKSDLRYLLAAPGSDLGVNIAVHGDAKRQDDHHIEITHEVGNNRSQVQMHAACDGKSRSIGTGRLLISPDAQKTDSGQVFRNLLLSNKAKADAIPELEVLADDVSANHGAASSPLDPSQLFYLMSRGLDEKTSKDVIVEGFLMDAFGDFKSPVLVDQLRTLLMVHLDCNLI